MRFAFDGWYPMARKRVETKMFTEFDEVLESLRVDRDRRVLILAPARACENFSLPGHHLAHFCKSLPGDAERDKRRLVQFCQTAAFAKIRRIAVPELAGNVSEPRWKPRRSQPFLA